MKTEIIELYADVLDEIEAQYDLNSCYRRIIGFELECLRRIEPFLPDFGRLGLRKAERYWVEGNESEGELSDTEEMCWNFVSEFEREDAPADVLSRCFALRCLVGVLHTKPVLQDIFEELDAFIVFLIQLVPDEAWIEESLRRHFDLNKLA